ncbi:MAG: hypothetical protein IJH34_17425 [Romboutsia sp.]|nr:hypothetical protein [Romboutsia sp.]
MKKSKKKFISFLTIFILLFVSISFSYSGIVSFANENKGVISYNLSSLKSTSLSNKKKSSYSKYSTNKVKLPSSGSFNSGSSKKNNSYTNKNNDTTIIKPDSGSFTTSPNSNSNSNGSSTTIKPDSGSFSTTPNSSNKSGSKDNSSHSGSYQEYDSGRGTYSGGTNWAGRLFRSYFNPYRTFGFVGGMSSWIVTLVTIIIVIIVMYIVIDYIRNRRD